MNELFPAGRAAPLLLVIQAYDKFREPGSIWAGTDPSAAFDAVMAIDPGDDWQLDAVLANTWSSAAQFSMWGSGLEAWAKLRGDQSPITGRLTREWFLEALRAYSEMAAEAAEVTSVA